VNVVEWEPTGGGQLMNETASGSDELWSKSAMEGSLDTHTSMTTAFVESRMR
jgi:hypothetical protein